MAASYPNAIKSFASRSNGQVIDAQIIDDLQDEVTAIETGLLQGTAPLNSSNTTVVSLEVAATLGVAGNTTLAAHVNIGSFRAFANSTIVGNLSIIGGMFSLWSVISGTTSITLPDGNTDDLVVGPDVFQVRLIGNSSVSTLTGIQSAAGLGRQLFVVNVGTAQIDLGHATGSVSSNRFQLPHSAAHTLNIADGALFIYDPVSACWRTALSP
jgi:hypothetical protein